MCVCVYICLFIYTYFRTNIYTCTYTYIHMCVHIYSYICISARAYCKYVEYELFLPTAVYLRKVVGKMRGYHGCISQKSSR